MLETSYVQHMMCLLQFEFQRGGFEPATKVVRVTRKKEPGVDFSSSPQGPGMASPLLYRSVT